MPPKAGWNKPLPSPCRKTNAISSPKLRCAGRVEHGERRDDERAGAVGTDQEQLARVAVGEHAADQERRDQAERLDQQHDPERARLVRERERTPTERHDEGGVADLRHGLAGPEQAEVLVTERLEDAKPRGGAHSREAILRPCRIESALPACR